MVGMMPRMERRKVRFARGIGVVFAFVACAFLSSCTDALLTEMARISREAHRPAIAPVDGSTIAAHETLTLSFPASMDPGSVTVSGDIGTVGPGLTSWSTAALSNDTLTLNANASVAWTAGSGKALTIAVTANGQSSTYSFSFNVVRGVYVNKSGTDSNSGSTRAPLQTVAAGITKAEQLYPGSGTVYIAEGLYSGMSPTDGSAGAFNMVDGISLYGGYSATAWSDRNIATYATILEDTATAGGTSQSYPNRTIDCGSGITSATVLDGLTIVTGAAVSGFNVGVYSAGAPTVQNCTIEGHTTSPGTDVYAVYSKKGGTFHANTIDPKAALDTSCGVYLEGSTATIRWQYNSRRPGSHKRIWHCLPGRADVARAYGKYYRHLQHQAKFHIKVLHLRFMPA